MLKTLRRIFQLIQCFHALFTRFNKIRVDPASGLVHRDDFQFAKTEGNPVRFARAGDCFSAASKCNKGKFQVDLSGTGLRMRKDVDWEAWGTPKLPQRLLTIRKAEDGTMAYGECGGSCGGCQPIKEKMFVEPAACTDPTTTGECLCYPKEIAILGAMHAIAKYKTSNISIFYD